MVYIALDVINIPYTNSNVNLLFYIGISKEKGLKIVNIGKTNFA